MDTLEELAQLIEAGAKLTSPCWGVYVMQDIHTGTYMASALGAAIIGEKPEYITHRHPFISGGNEEYAISRAHSILTGIYIDVVGFLEAFRPFVMKLFHEFDSDHEMIFVFTSLLHSGGETTTLWDILDLLGDRCPEKKIDPRELIVRVLRELTNQTQVLFQ